MATLMQAPADVLTYKAYMAEPWVRGRYDIVGGIRIFQPQVTWQRQRILGEISVL